MRDAELVFAIGGLISSFRWLDEYRIKFAGKSVNDVTEEAMRQRLGALEQMVVACGDDFPGVQKDFDELVTTLHKSHEKTPWDGRLPRQFDRSTEK